MGTPSADYWQIVENCTEDWRDNRLMSRDELQAVLWYVRYAFDETVKFGDRWTGCSFSQSEETTLMVSRREHAGIHQVVFVTGRTTTDCIRIFRKLWAEDALQWVRDKFRNS